MRTVSEKYANSSKYYMGDTDFFSTEMITEPIGFRLFAIGQLSLWSIVSIVDNRKNIRLSGTGALLEMIFREYWILGNKD